MQETKTLITLQEYTATPWVDVSGEIAVGGFVTAKVYARLGRLATTAFTAGVQFRFEGSPLASGSGWFPISTLITQLGASVGEEAVNGACVADQKVVPMASTTGFVVGDVVYIDNTTTANSEFGKIKVVTTDTSVTLFDNLANIQTGATVRDQAAIFAPVELDLLGIKRIRVVVDGSGGGQNFAAEVKMIGDGRWR